MKSAISFLFLVFCGCVTNAHGNEKAVVAPGASLVPMDVSAFYVMPDQPVTLAWRVTPASPVALNYEIRNYVDAVVRTGEAHLEGDRLEITLKLPRGYFEVRFLETNATFGVISIEPQTQTPDPFFCIDAALSSLETDERLRPPLLKALKRNGIAMARERLSWSMVNPASGRWEWDSAPRKHATLRRLYEAENIPVLEILGGYAPRLAHLEEIKDSPYPTNYQEIRRSWAGISRRFMDGWGAEETWNEPDLTQVPADQFVGMIKVGAFAAAEAGVRVPTGGGALATMPPGAFFETSAANGLLDHVDYVSFHTYSPALDMQAVVRRYRDWLRASRRETMPLWITEAGCPWTIGPKRPPFAQDAQSALEITAKAIEARAAGVARFFPFVYVFYEEGGLKNFGMLGREATPLRSMGAYAHVIQALREKEYLGDLASPPPGITLARVFGRKDSDESWVVVLYSGRIGPEEVRLSLPILRAAGIDGRELKSSPAGGISLEDGLAYVWVDRSVIRPRLVQNTKAAQLYALGQARNPTRAPASPILLQYRPEATPSQRSARRYLVTEADARQLPVRVRIWNLGSGTRRVTPVLELPQKKGGVRTLVGNPVTVTAGGSEEASWAVDASTGLDVAKVEFIGISAQSDGGEKIAPLALPFLMEGSLARLLERHPVKTKVPLEAPNQWEKNVAPNGKLTLSAGPGAWRAEVEFEGAGSWVFPKLNLAESLNPSAVNGLVIRARILKPARHVTLYAYVSEQERFHVQGMFVADGEWHSFYVPFAEFTPAPGHIDMQNARLDVARIKQLALGFVSNGTINALEISDLWLVGAPDN